MSANEPAVIQGAQRIVEDFGNGGLDHRWPSVDDNCLGVC
jgi:hypothetical protein